MVPATVGSEGMREKRRGFARTSRERTGGAGMNRGGQGW